MLEPDLGRCDADITMKSNVCMYFYNVIKHTLDIIVVDNHLEHQMEKTMTCSKRQTKNERLERGLRTWTQKPHT